MKKSYQIAAFVALIVTNEVFSIDQNVTVNVRLAPGAANDAVQEALSAVGSGLGKQSENAARNVIGGGIKGGLRGARDAAESDELKDTTRAIFKAVVGQSAEGFAEAAEDKSVRANVHRGTKAWADTAGEGARGFKDGFKQNVKPHLTEMWRDLGSTVWNVRNMLQFGGLMAGSIAIPVTGYYGTKVFWNVLEKRLTNPKPEIIVKQAHSVFGRADRWRRWWSGYKTPAMIFDQLVKERLTQIEEKTKAIRNAIYHGRKMTYDNLLLYGEPGTGKTLFAQILADKTDMDFLPVTAASLLQSGVEGIKYFNELLDLANRSKHGVIIFIDEADALFVDRNTLSPESDHYKVLNHILAITGDGSNKFMIVAATNHAYVMDQAMGRRFQDRVHMPLPDAKTRGELLDLYFATTLLNQKENGAQFVAQAQDLLTPQLIKSIVEKTNGLSHAEIKDMVSTMNKAAQITTISAKIIADTVEQAVEKHAVLQKEKEQREERFAMKKEQVAAAAA